MKFRRLISFLVGVGLTLAVLAPTRFTIAYTGPFDTACSGNATATVCQEKQQSQTLTDNSIYGPNGIITKIARLLSLVIGVAAVVMIMVAGFKFITSQGDANQVASARNTAIYAGVGLVVVALAQSIIIFVLDKIK